MELKDFENRIKSSLEARHIAPSNSAWNKLDQQLGDEEKKRSKIVFWSLSIASILLLGFIVSRSLFIETTVPFSGVESQASSEHQTESAPNENEPLLTNQQELNLVQADETPSNKEVSSTKDINSTKKLVKQGNPLFVNETNKKKQSLLSESQLEAIETPSQLEENPMKPIVISDASISNEADNLLANAKENIKSDAFKPKAFHPATNATLLLVETENEMEKSIGEKFLFTLKDGVKEAKSLIANTEGFKK